MSKSKPERKGFTFYFSFRDAGRMMKPKQRAAYYEAIIEYAATGVEPTLPTSISGCWSVTKPALDTAKKRFDARCKASESNDNKSESTDFVATNVDNNALLIEKREKNKEEEEEKGVKKKRKEEEGKAVVVPSPTSFPAGQQAIRSLTQSIVKSLPTDTLATDTEELRAKALKKLEAL